MKKTALLWKYEYLFFALFVFFNLVPLLTSPYFPTVDGPAHLHNANLLKHLWFYGEKNILNFFDVNQHLNSNILDHIWFACLGLFLPTFLVEKSMLLFYIIALPYSFRFLVKKVVLNKNSGLIASYLIFPFIYSFTFRIGFFNFSVGIPLVFWSLGMWLRDREQLTTKKMVALTVLTTILYISHIFNFMLFGIILFTNEIQYIIKAGRLKDGLIKLIKPVIIFFPGLILSALFFLANSKFTHAPPSYLPKGRLLWMLLDLNPIITLNFEREVLFAHITGIAIVGLLILVGYKFFKERKEGTPFKPWWLVSTIVVLSLFFVFPDWVASGGFISIRWALFFFLMIIIIIASKELPVKQLLIPVIVILIIQLFFLNYHNEQTKILSADAEVLIEAEDYMDNNTVLLPLNYSTNWMHINHANYMATKKNIINLDNYEPTKPHFPLIWKKGEVVYDLMPKYGNRMPPCINIDAYEQHTHHHIDYLSRFYFNGDVTDSCSALIEKEINSRFKLIFESTNKHLQLYKRKPNT